jgi:hypothetical protein
MTFQAGTAKFDLDVLSTADVAETPETERSIATSRRILWESVIHVLDDVIALLRQNTTYRREDARDGSLPRNDVACVGILVGGDE